MSGKERASIVDCVLDHGSEHPHRTAIVSEDGALSYAELGSRIGPLARLLTEMGIGRGDVVGVLSHPLADAYELHLALIAVGAVWLGINPAYKYPEMEFIAQDARPVAIFFVSEHDGRDYVEAATRLRDRVSSIRHLVCLDRALPGIPSFAALRSGSGGAPAELAPRDPEDVALIVYTSGSTGKPKGCLLRNKSMVHRARMQIRDFDFHGEYPVLYNPWPMNHVGGIQLISAYAMVAAGTLVFRRKFDPEGIGRTVRENRVNTLILLPTMFHMMFSAKSFDSDDFASVELFMFVGGSLSPDQIRRLQEIGHGRVQTNYGLSEGHSTVTISQPGLDPETLSVTLGRSKDGEVRVVDEDGRVLAQVGQQGELQVRREFCMKGYLNRPDANAEVFTPDGWLRTGDRVELLEKGEMRLVGRMSEMYKSGGYNIYPREIEMCLEEHGDVGLAAVVKRPDPLFGEVGIAYVVPRRGRSPSAESLKKWCKAHIADYKVPKDFVIGDEVPLLPNNKIDKKVLQQKIDQRSS